jgi:hypothetical protein
LASLLNPLPTEPRSNQALLMLDGTRQACFYTKTTVHLIVDLTGWLMVGGDMFHPVSPFRALDTRFGPRPDGGTGRPASASVLEIPVTGHNNVALDATAVAANVTLTDPEADGFVTLPVWVADAADLDRERAQRRYASIVHVRRPRRRGAVPVHVERSRSDRRHPRLRPVLPPASCSAPWVRRPTTTTWRS